MTKSTTPRPRAVRLLAVVLAAVVLGGCSGSPGPGTLFESLPESLLDRGAVWRPDAGANGHLIALLGVDADEVASSIVTGAPAVTLLDAPGSAGAEAALRAAGYDVVEAPAGWTVLARGPVTEATVGVPSVGLRDGLVVAGSLAEVEAVIAQGAAPTTPVPVELLEGAVIALAGTPATAEQRAPDGLTAALPDYNAFVITAMASGAGVVGLVAEDAEQADAVALSVRASTALLEGGMAASTLLAPGEPLAVDDRVLLNVEWLVAPETLLDGRVGTWLAGMLRVS